MAFNISNFLSEELRNRLRERSRAWLITGAAGFIGGHICEALLQLGQEVRALDNFATGMRETIAHLQSRAVALGTTFCFKEHDLALAAPPDELLSNVDVVLHNAALGSVPRSLAYPVLTHRANVDGFVNMLEGCRLHRVGRLIFASSSSVYGDNNESPKFEDHLGKLLSPYALSKRTNELYAELWQRCYTIPTLGLRYFNVFGPRQSPKGEYAAVIPRWIDSLFQGESCTIYGDGQTSRDFCFIANVVEANLLAGVAPQQNLTGQSCNIACGSALSLEALHSTLATLVSEETGQRSPALQYAPARVGDIRHSLASLARAEEILGYRTRVSAHEGLREYVRYEVSRRGAA